jgi:hypothetical protein
MTHAHQSNAFSRIGIARKEWEDHRAAGDLWCSRCRQWFKPENRGRGYCTPCMTRYCRERRKRLKRERSRIFWWEVVSGDGSWGTFDSQDAAIAQMHKLRLELDSCPADIHVVCVIEGD